MREARRAASGPGSEEQKAGCVAVGRARRPNKLRAAPGPLTSFADAVLRWKIREVSSENYQTRSCLHF